ncbi:MAG: type II toxin-antitoxin system death-on-curing family toxin [Thermodesulfobacteriota bacterium]
MILGYYSQYSQTCTNHKKAKISTVYLSVVEVLTMHYILIERYGGAHGLRNVGAFVAALYRPQTGCYEYVIAEAASLWESMTVNHPFIDGNKLIGFAVTDTFLRLNGYRISAPADKIWRYIDGLFSKGKFEFAELDKWLRKNTEEIS